MREVRAELIKTFAEVDEMQIEPIRDDYKVRVNIKDSSIYAYAPRRMSYNEKMKLREITDNLLEREIIKPNSSPYCARVVPVKKEW